MASSASSCASTKCEFFSCARCHCCNQDLCPDHIKEHKDQLNFKLIPLTDEINALSSGLEHFSLDFAGLEKWRAEAHQTIDSFYGWKRQELLEERKKQSRDHLHQIQSNVALLLQKQGATHENIESLTKSIDSIRQQLNELREARLVFRPLTIDNNMILLTTADNEQRDGSPHLLPLFTMNFYDSRSVTELHSTTPKTQARNRPHSMQVAQSRVLHTEPPKHSQVLQNDALLTVFVRLEERTVSIQIGPFDTILQLKHKIKDKEGIPVHQLGLTFVGKLLKDAYTLAMTAIHNRSTLDCYYAFPALEGSKPTAKQAKKR